MDPARRSGLVLAAGAVVALASAPSEAFAQTWSAGRSSPVIDEIVTVDRTGEASWPFGAEDLAGDGATFQPAEQAVDIRTAYAATDAMQLWFRVFVSSQNAPPATDIVYLFIDADANTGTGGTANAPAIDPKLTTDPSGGGYEFVVGVRGDATMAGLWRWDVPTTAWVNVNLMPMAAQAEAGVDTDPILFSFATHGYLQARINLTLVGLTQACAANFYFRSVDSTPTGVGDLDVGNPASCIPIDMNDDGVPDPIMPTEECMVDADCPFYGVCVGAAEGMGHCVFAPACDDPSDCAMDETCVNGHCVVNNGGPCEETSECGALVCNGTTCVACTPGGTQCGEGRVCGPDGRCIGENGGTGGNDGGFHLEPGQVIRGGPCACEAPGSSSGESGATLAVAGLAIAFLRRRRRAMHGQPSSRSSRAR